MRTEDLLDSFPGEPVVEDDQYLFSIVRNGRIFNSRYKWILESSNGRFHFTEEAYISRIWYFLLTMSMAGVCLGYIGFNTLSGALALLSFFAMVFLLIQFAGFSLVFTWVESPVSSLFGQGRNHTQLIPIASLVLIVFPLLVLVIAIDGLGRVLSFLGIVTGITVYGVFHSWVVEQSFRWQSWFVMRMKRFPLIAGNYVTSLVLSSVILVVFLLTHDTPLFVVLASQWPNLFPMMYAAIVLLLVALIGKTVSSAWRFETNRFQDKGRNITDTKVIALTAGFVVVSSFGFGYLSYRFLVDAASFLVVQSSVGAYSYVLVSGIPVLYFATGLVYQSYRFCRGVIKLFRRSEQHDLDHILDIDAETYVLDHDGIYAGAITVLNDHIIISQGILNQLSEEEVAAVMAHEEGHLKHRDAVLGLLLTIIAPFALTGKNILYGVLDFRSREFQADQYAATRIEKRQQLVDALDSLQEIAAEEATHDVPSVTPTLLSLDSNENNHSIVERIFGFYFGEFAMTQVHPNLVDRKNRVPSETDG